jgi:hypothetical protein
MDETRRRGTTAEERNQAVLSAPSFLEGIIINCNIAAEQATTKKGVERAGGAGKHHRVANQLVRLGFVVHKNPKKFMDAVTRSL